MVPNSWRCSSATDARASMTHDRSSGRKPALLARLRHGIDALSLAIAAMLLAAFTLAVIYVVGSRYLFSHTPDWAEELPRLLLVWSTFAGIVPATLRNSHLTAGLALFGANAFLAIMVRVLVSLFFLVLGYAGWQLSLAGLDDLSTALQIPFAVSYAAIPLFCALAAIGNLLPRAQA